MAEQSELVVLMGRKPVFGVVAKLQAAGEVREATTGRIVPRVWAVAAPQPVRQGSVRTQSLAARAESPQTQATPAGDLGFYRKYTERLLLRYVQMTMEAGRVSSVMGREVIGGRASSYRIHGFDDAVIFRLDVEKCLRQLDPQALEVIRRIAIQEYTQQEAADLMGVSLRTAGTRYSKALDRLTGILLQTRILEPWKGCQVGQRQEWNVNRSN